MLRGVAAAFTKDLRLLARDRVGVVFLTLAPIIVITVAGFSLMASVLTLQGLLQGTMLGVGADFVDSMVAMKPYWLARTLAGATMDIGALLGMWNFYLTVMQGRPIQARANAPAGAASEPQWT